MVIKIGADVKTNGAMRGMSRDKGGAAGIAGFLKTVYVHDFMDRGILQPNHLHIVAELAFVRNSVGWYKFIYPSDAYVSDEIIKSRAGLRVLVGNTDAEGRMVMADLLAEAKEDALISQKNFPNISHRLYTVATLTGNGLFYKRSRYSSLWSISCMFR